MLKFGHDLVIVSKSANGQPVTILADLGKRTSGKTHIQTWAGD